MLVGMVGIVFLICWFKLKESARKYKISTCKCGQSVIYYKGISFDVGPSYSRSSKDASTGEVTTKTYADFYIHYVCPKCGEQREIEHSDVIAICRQNAVGLVLKNTEYSLESCVQAYLDDFWLLS